MCCLFYYRQSFPNLCHHQIVVSVTISSPETSYIWYVRISSPIYQYVVNLVMSQPIRRGPGVLMKVPVLEYSALLN
jgi:hypothetical protein